MQTELTITQFAMIIGIICGFVFGLIPLILGFVKKNIKFGLIGFVLSIIAGSFLSLLGVLPVVAVFVWLILRKPSETKSTGETVEDPSESSVEDSQNPSGSENEASGD